MLSDEEREMAASGNPYGWMKFYSADQNRAEIFDAFVKAQEYIRIWREAWANVG